MKNMHNIILGVLVILVLIFSYRSNVIAKENQNDDKTRLIYDYAEAVANKDIDKYISLFSENVQEEMRIYLKNSNEEDFFKEETCEILSIEEKEIAYKQSTSNIKKDSIRYIITENIRFKKDINQEICKVTEGINTCEMELIREDTEWKIDRISAINNVESAMSASSLNCPSETVIYFTKTDNVAHWGVYSKNIMWNDYMKNVIPGEWVVSYFNPYPAYGKVAALTTKMYAWYNTVNPKWYFSPYYACMKDNSSDQNYIYYAYDSLPSNCKNYLNTALSQTSNLAMVKSNNAIFEVHYSSDSTGGYHTGKLDQGSSLAFAQASKTYSYILHYYFDQSVYTGGTNMNIVTY